MLQNERIVGTFHVQPNAKNRRDLDIVIHYEFECVRSRARHRPHCARSQPAWPAAGEALPRAPAGSTIGCGERRRCRI